MFVEKSDNVRTIYLYIYNVYLYYFVINFHNALIL